MKILPKFVFVVGFLLCSYPVVSSMIVQRYQDDTVATYESVIERYSDNNIKKELEKAFDYNRRLYQAEEVLVGDVNDNVLNEKTYQKILNLSENGVMGSIEIPKIHVNLPIYHGTSDTVLNTGIGHVRQSSFPVGGIDTRAVLAGHRGLPTAKLFTRLDEMEEGDLFFINVLSKVFAYRVCEIAVIEPEEVEKLAIVDGKDLVTLLTCTPYGLNTHRLLVTGERVEYIQTEYDTIESSTMSLRETLFFWLPFVFIVIVIVTFIKNRYIKRKKESDRAVITKD